MKTNIKISVVTISYNQVDFLERAIESIASQRGVDVEYIIVDPGSTDGSRELIERHSDKFAQIILDPDDGPADGLNRGLACATAEFFFYLNADDEVYPHALEAAANYLSENPDVDVVYANGEEIDEEGTVRRRLISSLAVTPTTILAGAGTIIQQSAVMRTVALRAVGGFNPENRTCWDGEAFLDMAVRGSAFHRIWDTWGRFRIHPSSISGSQRLQASYHADLNRMFRKVRGRAPGPLDLIASVAVRWISRAADFRGSLGRLASRLGG